MKGKKVKRRETKWKWWTSGPGRLEHREAPGEEGPAFACRLLPAHLLSRVHSGMHF